MYDVFLEGFQLFQYLTWQALLPYFLLILAFGYIWLIIYIFKTFR